jgi:N-glycosidase YbiA
MPIYFYSTRGLYGCFSNFSRHSFQLDGMKWPTSEHYFQAQKFAGTPYADEVRCVDSPRKAAELGRRRDWPLRNDWELVKDEVMRRAVRQKFESHPDILEVLLSTGDEILIEDSPTDGYWGYGADRTGQNHLGQILMELRDAMRAVAKVSNLATR